MDCSPSALSDDALIAVWGGTRIRVPTHTAGADARGGARLPSRLPGDGRGSGHPRIGGASGGHRTARVGRGCAPCRGPTSSPHHGTSRCAGSSCSSLRQRELVESADESGELRLSIRYRTGRRVGSERIEHAIAVLRRAGFDDGVVTEVEELGEWIGGFPEDAMVELDYGGVAAFFDGAELALDDSAAEVWASIEALDAEDWQGAGTALPSRRLPLGPRRRRHLEQLEGDGSKVPSPRGELPTVLDPAFAPLGVNRSPLPRRLCGVGYSPRRGERFVVKAFVLSRLARSGRGGGGRPTRPWRRRGRR